MIGCFQWAIYLWQRTAGPFSFFSLTACASIWTGRSAIAGNIWMYWNTRKDSSRTQKIVVLYCVCVCWIQCFDLPRVTATFWLRIGLTGSFLNQGWDPEGSLQDPPVTSHVVPWGQQWMKSLQHTAYWKNWMYTCYLTQNTTLHHDWLFSVGDLPVAEDSRPILLL